MGQSRTLFLFFYTSFSLAFCLLGLVVYEVAAASLNDIECTGKECTSGQHGDDLDFSEMDMTNEGPSEEEWIDIISALSERQPSRYITRHGLVVHQTQTGVYNYSYGNNGTYHSKQFGKMNKKGRKTHSTGMYFQLAEGQTGETKYASGFIIFSKIHSSMDKQGAKWEGKEKGIYFNKNPDGSYLVFGRSCAGMKGKGLADGKTKFTLTTSADGILNTTTFAAKASYASNTTMDFSTKKDIDVTGNVEFSARSAGKDPKDLLNDVDQNSGFTLDAIASFKGTYPKGKGTFHNDLTGTITGSVINSTLVVSTKGKIWIERKHHEHGHLKTLLETQFWFSIY